MQGAETNVVSKERVVNKHVYASDRKVISYVELVALAACDHIVWKSFWTVINDNFSYFVIFMQAIP